MKKIVYFILSAFISGAVFNSCTDDFEEINTNPNKVYDVDVNDVFAGTVSRTMKLYGELNYNRLLNFSRYAVVQFNTNPGQDTGDSYFKQFYVDIIRDLVKLERQYIAQPEGFENRLAVVKTWKSYVFYMMASIYGPVPMSDAITDGSGNKRSYKYDAEKEIYTAILNDLKKAGELFDPKSSYVTDIIASDPVFGKDGIGASDLNLWKKFANTLRLNIAMHVQNLDQGLSREHALAALQEGLISNVSENVVLRWGLDTDKSASYYYTRFIKNVTSFQSTMYPAISEYFYIYMATYNDPRLSAYCKKSNEMASASEKAYLYTDTLTRPHICLKSDKKGEAKKCPDYAEHQADGYNKFRRDSILVEYTMPYVPLAELNNLPAGWRYATVPGETYTYHDPLDQKKSNYNYSFVQDNFVKESATMVLLTYADACFLKAEAELLYNNNEPAAKAAYEAGIQASMNQYGKSAEANAYLEQPGIKWGTDGLNGYHDRRILYKADIHGSNGNEGNLEQIYKQRYFADFFNGLEGWNLERRTRVMDYPPFFLANASSNIEGLSSTYNYWTERFIYPELEKSKNGTAYMEGISKLQGSSPFYRTDRWGDNVYTSLGFAKKNPQLDHAEALWGYRELVPTCDYFNKKYGFTYEEVVITAKEITGEKLEAKALAKISYGWKETLGTFDTEDMPEPEPEPDPEPEP